MLVYKQSRIIRIISLVVILPFIWQDYLLANPDIEAHRTHNLQIQPLSRTILSDIRPIIESQLAGIALRIKNPQHRVKLINRLLGKRSLLLPVEYKNTIIFVDLDFINGKEVRDGLWVIPCAVNGANSSPLKCDAVLSIQNKGEKIDIKIASRGEGGAVAAGSSLFTVPGSHNASALSSAGYYPYPLKVPLSAKVVADTDFGANKLIANITLSGFEIDDRQNIPGPYFDQLKNILEELEQLLGGRTPSELRQWTLIISTDLNLTRGNIAACSIGTKTLYLHPYFFELTKQRRIKILYRELLTYIAKGVTDEDAADKDARSLTALLAVNRAWQGHIKKYVEKFDQTIMDKKESLLARFYHAMRKSFQDIAWNIYEGKIDPYAQLNLMQNPSGQEDSKMHDLDREVRVAFFATAANPLNWGHILPPLMSMAYLDLDFVVLRVQGKISYKNLLPSERVSIAHRHHMAKESIKRLFPLIRYTDLGSEEDNDKEGSEEMHRFLALNKGKKVNLFYLIGAENEFRMWKYMLQQYQMFKIHGFGANPNHKITFGVIQRGSYGGVVTKHDLEEISVRIREGKPGPILTQLPPS